MVVLNLMLYLCGFWFSILLMFIALIDFCIVSQPCFLRINPSWLWHVIILICWWSWLLALCCCWSTMRALWSLGTPWPCDHRPYWRQEKKR